MPSPANICGSLFALLYLGVNVSSDIQKPTALEWYTGITSWYDETYKV